MYRSLKARPVPFPYEADRAHRPGCALYTVFGFMAGVSGWLLWACFMGTCRVALLAALQLKWHTLTSISNQALTPTNIPSRVTAIWLSVSTVNGRDTCSTYSNRSNSSVVSPSSSSPTAKLSPRPQNSSCATRSAVSSGPSPASFWARSERCRNSDGSPISPSGSIS